MKKILLIFIVIILFKINLAFALKIHLFCNIENSHHINASLELEKIIFKVNDFEYPINLKHKIIKTKANFGQVYLGSIELPKDRIEGLNIYIKTAKVNGKKIEVKEKSKYLGLYVDLSKSKHRNLILFIVWDVSDSFRNGKFVPALSCYFAQKPRVEELLLALDKENEGIWVIDSAFNRVIYFIEIKGKPEYLISSQDKSEIYVLCSGDKTIKVINSNTLNIERVFSIAPLENPTFMDIDRAGNGVVVSTSDRKVALIDFTRGNVLDIKYVEFEPHYVCYIPQMQNYFISSSENAVYIFDNNLNRINRLNIPFIPISIFTDGDKIYISDTNGGVSIYSLPSFSFEGRINVCSLVWRGLVVRDKIYLTCEDGAIPYFYKGQRAPSGFIETKVPLYALSYSSYKEWLYASSYKKWLIAVVDVFNDRIRGYIELGGPVYEMVAIP